MTRTLHDNVILRVENLKEWFIRQRFLCRSSCVKAVDGISFDIRRNEIFGLVGESGCGKTTTGRVILRLEEPTEGKVYLEGVDLFSLDKPAMKKMRRHMQIIYQNPYESMPERLKVRDIVSEGLSLQKICRTKAEMAGMVAKSLENVGLPPKVFRDRYLHELSGGQRQRVAIARALAVLPKFIVADEPVSMLDVSIRAGILNLMLELRSDHNLTYLFITHDIAVARYICDRIGVMYMGKIMESGPVKEIVSRPVHPYTKALMSAVPIPNPRETYQPIPIKGEISDSSVTPLGCRFSLRCPFVNGKCRKVAPDMVEVKPVHYAACHMI